MLRYTAISGRKGRPQNYLSVIHGVLFGGILFCCACSGSMGPKGLSHGTYAATQKAVEALEAASQDRSASTSIFNPKLEAASKAAEEVYYSISNQKSDAYAATQIRTCVEELKAYRSNYDSRQSASGPIEEQLKGLKGAEVKDANDVLSRNSSELDECLREAKAYL